jgi:hypothetical protein
LILSLARTQKPIKMPKNTIHCLAIVLMETQKLYYNPLEIGIIHLEIAVIFRDKVYSRPQAGLSLNSNQS